MNKIVLNFLDAYLPTTMIWLYTQQQNLKGFEPAYLAENTMNLESFPSNHLYSLSELPPFERKTNRLQKRYLYFNRMYPYFNKKIRLIKPHILHAHFGNIGYKAIPYAQKFKLPLVTTFYGFDVNMLPNQKKDHFYQKSWRQKYKILFSKGDLFLCEGNFMRNALIHLGCPPEKVKVQHLGVQVDKIKYIDRNVNPHEPIRILVAGSFREKKGIPYALEAFAILSKKYNHIHLTLVGDSGNQPREVEEKRKIEAIIQKNQLEKKMTRYGYISYSHLMDLFYQHEIFLSPSVTASDGDTEGGAPVSLIDASSTGMAIVSSRHCDIPEVVLDNKTGLLSDERNIDEIVHNLESLIKNPEKIQIFGSNARKHVKAEYDTTLLSVQLKDYYLTLL